MRNLAPQEGGCRGPGQAGKSPAAGQRPWGRSWVLPTAQAPERASLAAGAAPRAALTLPAQRACRGAAEGQEPCRGGTQHRQVLCSTPQLPLDKGIYRHEHRGARGCQVERGVCVHLQDPSPTAPPHPGGGPRPRACPPAVHCAPGQPAAPQAPAGCELAPAHTPHTGCPQHPRWLVVLREQVCGQRSLPGGKVG